MLNVMGFCMSLQKSGLDLFCMFVYGVKFNPLFVVLGEWRSWVVEEPLQMSKAPTPSIIENVKTQEIE